MRTRMVEIMAGLFMIAGLLALLVLAFKISGLSFIGAHNDYVLTADFDNIGSLKVRAPVAVSGVTIGRVRSIQLDPETFRAKVTLQISAKMNTLPVDTAASILTKGLLGSNYINLTPGFDQRYLKSGGVIETTHSALILENLIGQLLFNVKKDKKG